MKILFHEARVLLREAIEAVCVENKWTPYAIEPMPDHVHIFLGAKTFHEDVLGSLKEQTSSFLKQCFSIYSNALTDERFWSGSYYISSIGNISGKTLLKYLAKQWKEFGDPRYELTIAALHEGQKTLKNYNPS